MRGRNHVRSFQSTMQSTAGEPQQYWHARYGNIYTSPLLTASLCLQKIKVGGSGLSEMTQVRFMVEPSFRWMSGPPRISVRGSATTRLTTCEVGGVVEIWHSYAPASRCRTGLICKGRRRKMQKSCRPLPAKRHNHTTLDQSFNRGSVSRHL